MESDTGLLNEMYASLIIDQLLLNGVNFFCLSPGSRNTPLTLAVAENKQAETVVHFDERGAGFHALGYIRATGIPAVLICTSGTAAANYLPAIVEASRDMLPLIVLTADRPPELQNCGANQTINQKGLYGDFVREEITLTCLPDSAGVTEIPGIINRLIKTARIEPCQPVHFNCPFREPLISSNKQSRRTMHDAPDKKDDNINCSDVSRPVNRRDLDDVIEAIKSAKNGIILLSRIESYENPAVIKQAVSLTGWPVIADISSGLRLGLNYKNNIAYHDLILSSGEFSLDQFDTVIMIGKGGQATSKALHNTFSDFKPVNCIHICSHNLNYDPCRIVTRQIHTNTGNFCKALVDMKMAINSKGIISGLEKADKIVDDTLSGIFEETEILSEPLVSYLVSFNINPESCLFLGNSMPVRDMNTYARKDSPMVPSGCNRGASGIDGNLASAIGFAKGHDKPLTLLIGDLSFLHDLNSLTLLKNIRRPATIIIINNNGGGIFSFLPVAQVDNAFDKYFGTPHNLSFKSTAEMFGLEYASPETKSIFMEAYAFAQKGKSHTIIEIKTNRNENIKCHRDIQNTINIRLGSFKRL